MEKKDKIHYIQQEDGVKTWFITRKSGITFLYKPFDKLIKDLQGMSSFSQVCSWCETFGMDIDVLDYRHRRYVRNGYGSVSVTETQNGGVGSLTFTNTETEQPEIDEKACSVVK
jgi:hypothetical protein